MKRTHSKQFAKNMGFLADLLADIRDDGQTFLWEFYAGEAELTRQASHHGHSAGEPMDIRRGYDLLDAAVQNRVLAMIDEWKPLLITLAFPCTPWSQLQKLNMSKSPQLKLKITIERSQAIGHLKFVKEMMLKQAKA